MPAINWEDPFCEITRNKAVPDLWVPGQKVAPVSLAAIRERQKPLLAPIQEWLKAADQALKRIQGSPGGDLLIFALRTQVEVEVLFRDPGYPGVLRRFGPIPLTCSPITFPASKKPVSSVFTHLLPAQKVTEQKSDDRQSGGSDKRKAILAAETEMGLIRRPALSSGAEMSKERVVVYPELLRFVGNWIENLISPITDFRYAELVNERGIQSGIASQPARGASLPRPQLN